MQTMLPFFGAVRVSGDDRASFLHGQLSNDISNLAQGKACYATYNTPKGRVLANMLVVNRGDDLLLVIAADLIEPIVKKLRMFVLRAKVVFEPLENFGAACRLADDAAAQPASEPSLSFAANLENGVYEIALPHSGILLLGETSALPAYDAAAEQAWQKHEILSGYPWVSASTKETAVAQMLNQHVIGGVHFRKGCYPGQEIIARAQYRGQVKRGLAVLSGSAAQQAGGEIKSGSDDTGLIINSVQTENGSLSLAVIKFSAAQAALTDANGNELKQEKLFFEVEEKE